MKEDVSSDIDRSNKSESEENEDKKNKDAQPQEQKKQKKESLEMDGKNISFNFFDIDWTFAFFRIGFGRTSGMGCIYHSLRFCFHRYSF